MVEQTGALAVFQQAPAVQERHLVAGAAGEAHLVRDHDEAGAGLLEVADEVKHIIRVLGVEGARGLVEQQHLGRRRHGACDGNALLLSARELGGALGLLGRQPEAREQVGGALAGLVLGHAMNHGKRSATFSSALKWWNSPLAWNTKPS